MNYGGYLICLYIYFLSFMCLVIILEYEAYTQYNKQTLLNRVVAGIYFMMTQPMSVCVVRLCVHVLVQCSTLFTLFTVHTYIYMRAIVFKQTKSTETIDNSKRETSQLLFNSMARLNANTSFFSPLLLLLVVFGGINERFLPVRPFPSFTRLPFFIFLHFTLPLHSLHLRLPFLFLALVIVMFIDAKQGRAEYLNFSSGYDDFLHSITFALFDPFPFHYSHF